MESDEDSVPQELIAACKHQTTQLYDMMKDNTSNHAEDCMSFFRSQVYFRLAVEKSNSFHSLTAKIMQSAKSLSVLAIQ